MELSESQGPPITAPSWTLKSKVLRTGWGWSHQLSACKHSLYSNSRTLLEATGTKCVLSRNMQTSHLSKPHDVSCSNPTWQQTVFIKQHCTIPVSVHLYSVTWPHTIHWSFPMIIYQKNTKTFFGNNHFHCKSTALDSMQLTNSNFQLITLLRKIFSSWKLWVMLNNDFPNSCHDEFLLFLKPALFTV